MRQEMARVNSSMTGQLANPSSIELALGVAHLVINMLGK